MIEENENLIFLVDDDEMYLKAMTHKVSKNAKAKVKSFTSGEDCLASINENPDLVVTDFFLSASNPDAMNGDELLKRVKEYDENISVLMMSAQEHASLASTFIKLGADDYIDKNLKNINQAMEGVSDRMKDIHLEKISAAQEKLRQTLLTFTFIMMMTTVATHFLMPAITPYFVGGLVAFSIAFVVLRRLTDLSTPPQ